MSLVQSENLNTILSRKHVLLDANVLIEAIESPDAFKEVIDFFVSTHCIPVHFPLVEFEVFRTTFQKEIRDAKQKYFDLWNLVSLPMKPELFPSALLFGQYYASQRISPSLTDCFIGAFLRQHVNDLYLVTRNHKDFPSPLFVRCGMFCIERPKDILTFGVYQYNKDSESVLLRFTDKKQEQF